MSCPACFNIKPALLKTGKVECDDLADEDSDQADDCTMEIMLREIVNGQNAQIQLMRGLLASKGYPENDDCKVIVDGDSSFTSKSSKRSKSSKYSKRRH